MPLTPRQSEDAKIWLEVCATEMEKLTEWEQNFIESVNDQYTNTGNMSERQHEILKKIYDKVV